MPNFIWQLGAWFVFIGIVDHMVSSWWKTLVISASAAVLIEVLTFLRGQDRKEGK